ncbi:MAG: hypothetical protein WA902_14420 [Thermosynechococcaceae cyanobacterium]
MNAASQKVFGDQGVYSFQGQWLLLGGGIEIDNTGQKVSFDIGKQDVTLFSPQFVGVGRHTFFGEYVSGNITASEYTGSGFTIGFGKGYLSDLGDQYTGVASLGGFVGISLPLF